MHDTQKSHWDIIIIGGGQAGLAMGYELKQLNKEFLILDATKKVGDSWRNRWDSLQLFTPAWTVKLPGTAFPKIQGSFPKKDEIARFLEDHAGKHQLPVLNNMQVTDLSKTSTGYQITAGGRKFTCNKVVVATGNYSHPKVPSFAADINHEIQQLHSSQYKRPADLPPGDVLVVGAGTSGLQIALDLVSRGKKVYISGNPPGKIPPFMLKFFGRLMIWMMNKRMTIDTKAGRKLRDAIKIDGQAAPLINISLEEVLAAGAERVPRIAGVRSGYPVFADDKMPDIPTRILRLSAIIWCTGFTRDFSWISNMDGIVDDHSYPLTHRGVSANHKGLYFLGMVFQYALTSSTLLGVGRDAKYIARHIQENP